MNESQLVGLVLTMMANETTIVHSDAQLEGDVSVSPLQVRGSSLRFV